MNVKRFGTALAVAAGMGASVAATALAGTVHAAPSGASSEQTDDAFVKAIHERGISLDDKEAIALAHSTCEVLSSGKDVSAAARHIQNETRWTDNDTITKFGGVAVAAYCPNSLPKK